MNAEGLIGPIREPGVAGFADDRVSGSAAASGFECPAWLSVGARALDIDTGRTGVVQFLQSADREVCTESTLRAERVRLRSVDSNRPGWWAQVRSLRWKLP
ncbi:hypothetical protein Sm713_36140 [Streptomyces sp. TS71-3]|nr:hypothetical protein Sm713_36140 [Streptomyces sp. TS71-3]